MGDTTRQHSPWISGKIVLKLPGRLSLKAKHQNTHRKNRFCRANLKFWSNSPKIYPNGIKWPSFLGPSKGPFKHPGCQAIQVARTPVLMATKPLTTKPEDHIWSTRPRLLGSRHTGTWTWRKVEKHWRKILGKNGEVGEFVKLEFHRKFETCEIPETMVSSPHEILIFFKPNKADPDQGRPGPGLLVKWRREVTTVDINSLWSSKMFHGYMVLYVIFSENTANYSYILAAIHVIWLWYDVIFMAMVIIAKQYQKFLTFVEHLEDHLIAGFCGKQFVDRATVPAVGRLPLGWTNPSYPLVNIQIAIENGYL